MPIIRHEDGGVSVEYNLPKELKDLITEEFAHTMAIKVMMLWDYIKTDMDLAGVLGLEGSTSGIYDAFAETCDALNLEQFKNASKLDWYDYDLFIDQVCTAVAEVYFGGKEKYNELFEEFYKINYEPYEDSDDEVADKTNILSEGE